MRIIAIGAHLDDIELACGGTLAKAVKKGYKVKMLVMSKSAYANFDGKVLRTEEEALREGTLAAERLGVSDVEVLNFNTKDIPYSSKSVEAIERVMSLFGPDLIFTHWIFDTHHAHKNTGLSTISAARYRNNILMYEPYPPSGRSYFPFRPQVYVDITDSIESKVLAVQEHKSQYTKYGGKDLVEAIEGRARMRGFENDCKYAEVFELVRFNLKI